MPARPKPSRASSSKTTLAKVTKPDLQTELQARDLRIADLQAELRMARHQLQVYERRRERLRRLPLWQSARVVRRFFKGLV